MKPYFELDMSAWGVGVVVAPLWGIGLLIGPFQLGIRWGKR